LNNALCDVAVLVHIPEQEKNVSGAYIRHAVTECTVVGIVSGLVEQHQRSRQMNMMIE
jgi:hypothetical protein